MLRMLVISVLMAVAGSALAEPDLDQVLDRLVEHYGGAANLARLDRVTQRWAMTSGRGGPGGSDLRYVSLPDRLRVELTHPNRREVRVLVGDHGFQMFDGEEPRIAMAPLRDAMRLQLMRLYSPLTLQARRELLQLVTEGGGLTLRLEQAGIRIDYRVDTPQWVIASVTGTLSMNGAPMQFLTEYSDFRKVDGVLVHHHEDKFAGNVPTASLDLLEIRFETGFPPAVFDPAAGAVKEGAALRQD